MKKQIILAVALAMVLFVPQAKAQYNVDWGTSTDTGNSGFTDLGKWFFDNGYAASQAAGEDKAKTGYIGYGALDADPFFFSAPGAQLQLVQSVAGNANLTSFGIYTGTGVAKSLTGVLGAGETGPKSVGASSPFGIYMHTPKWWQGNEYTDWFTDRTENGNDPHGLIYRLNSSEYLVAWEDMILGSSDKDYNDAYLKVTAVTPEPASMALFGLGAGLLGFSGIRRRKKA